MSHATHSGFVYQVIVDQKKKTLWNTLPTYGINVTCHTFLSCLSSGCGAKEKTLSGTHYPHTG